MKLPALIGLLVAGFAAPVFAQDATGNNVAPAPNAPMQSIVGSRMIQGKAMPPVTTITNGKVVDGADVAKKAALPYCDDPKIALDTSGTRPACKEHGAAAPAAAAAPTQPQLRQDDSKTMRSDKDLFSNTNKH